MLYELYDQKNNYVGEKVLINQHDDYVGVITGRVYHKNLYHPAPIYKAKLVTVLPNEYVGICKTTSCPCVYKGQQTKNKFLNCILDVTYAFDRGNHKIYKCEDIQEYFYDTELEFFNT